MKLVDTLVTELNPADTEIAAAIYNAQGASCEATGETWVPCSPICTHT